MKDICLRILTSIFQNLNQRTSVSIGLLLKNSDLCLNAGNCQQFTNRRKNPLHSVVSYSNADSDWKIFFRCGRTRLAQKLERSLQLTNFRRQTDEISSENSYFSSPEDSNLRGGVRGGLVFRPDYQPIGGADEGIQKDISIGTKRIHRSELLAQRLLQRIR